MRVLHIMASGERGGGADHLLGVIPALIERGIECRAAVGDNGPLGGFLRDRGVDVETVHLMGGRAHPRGVAEVSRVVRASGPDVVHLHGTRAAFFGALARVAGRWPSVYTAHGVSFRKEGGRLASVLSVASEALACRGASRVVSVSRSDLDELVRRRLVAPGRGSHIPNAVDLARLGVRTQARALLGLDEDRFVVGTVARLVAQKAVEDLVEAVSQCAAGVHLVVVGDGPRRAHLEQLATQLAVEVTFAGERHDVPALLPAFDLFALSSRWEGEPVALLEALAAGLPCVATATPGSSEVLAGVGRLVPVGCPAELAGAIDRLRGDDQERGRLAAGARAAVAGRTFDDVAARLIDVYQLAVDRDPG